jgi:ribonuclease P/MRP protein subunit POP1
MSKLSRKDITTKKRQNEEIISLPQALSQITLPRQIDLESFFQARMLELDHFLALLNDKAAVGGKMGNKRSFQLLPKHMRRRAMSHNSHRVPSRIRHLAQSSATLKNPCRKTRRHTKNILKDYASRNSNIKWLETHVWHAKRMKMQSLWGYKLAYYMNDKGIRASYRFMKNSAVLYDSSYYAGLIIKDLEFVKTSLKHLKSQEYSTDTYFYHNGQLISPVETFYSEKGLVLLVHPAGYAEIIEVLKDKNIEYIDLKDQLSVFRIRGSKSTEVLKNSIQILEKPARGLITSASLLHNFKFPDGALISVSFDEIAYKKGMASNTTNCERLIPVQPSSDLLNLIMNWPSTLYSPSFWQDLKEKAVSHAPEKITTRSSRSRYPSSRNITQIDIKKDKNPVVPLINPNPASFEVLEESKEKRIPEENDSYMQVDSLDPEKASEDMEKKFEHKQALLVYRKEEFGDGWDVILKTGNNNWLWRNLVYAGAKALGLSEYSSIFFEQGKLFYPDDYPTTKAYNQMALDRAKEKITEYFKKPSSKRMNYEKIGSPFPFFSDWSFGLPGSNADLLPVQIKCLRRCPKALGYLCKAEPGDLNSLTDPYKEPLHEVKKPNSKTVIGDLDELKKITPSREIIGFVTSGRFSFSRNRGFGIGYISKHHESQLGRKILFRNPSSSFYHLCSLAPLNKSYT